MPKSKQFTIHDIDKEYSVVVSDLHHAMSCFYRAAFIQSFSSRFNLKFGILLHWEEVNGKKAYNSLWKEHVWAEEKITGRIFDSYSAIRLVLAIEIPGLPSVKFNPKATASVGQIDQVELSLKDYPSIDKLHHKYKTDFLYLEGSFDTTGVSPENIEIRKEMAMMTRTGKEYDYRYLLA